MEKPSVLLYTCINLHAGTPSKIYHVTSDTLGREFDPGKRDFSH